MKTSFHNIEQAIDRVEELSPGSPRQEVILNRLFCHINSRLICHWNEVLKPFGINETLWLALLTLYSHPEQTLYPSDISDTLDFSRTNATRVSDELVKNGWAIRTACCDDRRKILLKMSFIESLLPTARQCLVDQWRDFDVQEKDALEDLMRKLLSTLNG